MAKIGKIRAFDLFVYLLGSLGLRCGYNLFDFFCATCKVVGDELHEVLADVRSQLPVLLGP